MMMATVVLLLQFPVAPATNKAPQAIVARSIAAAASVAHISETTTAAGGAVPATTPGNDSTSTRDAAAIPEIATSPARPAAQPMPEVIASLDTGPGVLPLPAFRPLDETPRIRRAPWMALTIAEHASASFDAFATRRALSNGKVEMDPLMRPFANSAAIYGAIQVIPFGLDYVGRRWQRSSGWERHIWWLPQSLATATFLFSGSYDLAHSR